MVAVMPLVRDLLAGDLLPKGLAGVGRGKGGRTGISQMVPALGAKLPRRCGWACCWTAITGARRRVCSPAPRWPSRTGWPSE